MYKNVKGETKDEKQTKKSTKLGKSDLEKCNSKLNLLDLTSSDHVSSENEENLKFKTSNKDLLEKEKQEEKSPKLSIRRKVSIHFKGKKDKEKTSKNSDKIEQNKSKKAEGSKEDKRKMDDKNSTKIRPDLDSSVKQKSVKGNFKSDATYPKTPTQEKKQSFFDKFIPGDRKPQLQKTLSVESKKSENSFDFSKQSHEQKLSNSEKTNSEKLHSEKMFSEKIHSEKNHSEKLNSDKLHSEKIFSEKFHSGKLNSEKLICDKPSNLEHKPSSNLVGKQTSDSKSNIDNKQYNAEGKLAESKHMTSDPGTPTEKKKSTVESQTSSDSKTDRAAQSDSHDDRKTRKSSSISPDRKHMHVRHEKKHRKHRRSEKVRQRRSTLSNDRFHRERSYSVCTDRSNILDHRLGYGFHSGYSVYDEYLNSDRERTNSISSCETTVHRRKMSNLRTFPSNQGKIPWCGCWGNGCL